MNQKLNRHGTQPGSKRRLALGVAAVLAVAPAGVLAAPMASAQPVASLTPAATVVGDATTSPDGDIAIGVGLNSSNHLVYSVVKDGVNLVNESALGLNLVGGETLGDDVEITGVSAQTTTDETWDTFVGTDKEVRNHFNERTYSIQDGTYSFQVIARAYDDGVAFRYNVPSQSGLETLAIVDEVTSFDLTGNPDAWWTHQNFDDDEALWQQSKFSEMGSSNAPVTFRWANGDHLSIHEAHLDDYSAMTLKKVSPTSLRVELVPSLTRAAAVVREGDGRDAPTPWRSFTISDGAGGLIESHLLENLNPAPDPVLFADADEWVKGATYVGIWWMLQQDIANWHDLDSEKHGASLARVKQYIDFAAANGIQGVLAEGWNKGWDGHWGDQDFDALAGDLDESIFDYAESKGVEFIGHNETGANPWYYEDQILGIDPVNTDFPATDGVKLFEQYQEWGINYIKTGYVGTTPNIPSREDYETSGFDLTNFTAKHHRYDQEMVNHFRFVLEEAAKYQINVNCHECVHGTGEIRTFPNAISREAVRGGEWEAFSGTGNPPEHQLILPFTRGLSAPMDYTPGIMNVTYNNRNQGSWRVHSTASKQLAMTINYFSGVQMAADMIEHYSLNRGIEYYDGLPAQWDESRVQSAEIGDHLVTARRSGTNWWLGAMNAESPRDLTYSLDFLGTGEWVAEIFGDSPVTDYDADPISLEVTKVRVTSADSITAQLGKSSGQAIRFRPATEADAALPAYEPSELTVASVSAPASAEQGDIVNVTARVVNNGSLTARKAFQVSVNGRAGATQEAALAAGGATTIRFAIRVVGNSPVRVVVGGAEALIDVTRTVPVPQNVRLVSVSSSQVTIAWDAVSGASYEVYRRADQGNYGANPLATVAADTTTFTDQKRSNGNNYVIRAVLDGKKSAASAEVSQFGTLVGSFSDPAGDDNGPGTYTYPTNGVYSPGTFDLTGIRVYDTGNSLTFVTAIRGNVENPWGCTVICHQLVEVYFGNGSATPVAARPGTNLTVAGGWSHVAVINGRWNSGVYSAPGGTKVADIGITGTGSPQEFAASIPKSALPAGFDVTTGDLAVAMYAVIETDDAIGNIRPVLNTTLPCNIALGFVSEWRPGGGAGCLDFGIAAKDSDTSDGNAFDVLTPAGTTQAEALAWQGGATPTIPLVRLEPPVADSLAELVTYGGASAVKVGETANPAQGVTALSAAASRLAGIPVTFTLAGPATFVAGGQVAVVTTNASGEAALPQVKAGSTAGTVAVTATAGSVTQALAAITVTTAPVPAPQVALTTPTFSKASQVFGHKSPATVTTRVTGLTAGTVTFRSGTKSLGTAKIVKSGSVYQARLTLPRTLAAGAYRQTVAQVTPAGKPVVTSGQAKIFTVKKARPGKVTAKAKRYARGTRPVVNIAVGKLNNGAIAVGRVTVRVNGKAVRTVKLKKNGKVTVRLAKKLSRSKSLRIKATFKATNKKNVANRSSKTVRVKARR